MKKEIKTWGIHWFRRDLRLAGNTAFKKNLSKHPGRVLGLFSFDSSFLSREDFSHDRFQFFLNTLDHLKKEMQDLGGDLIVLGNGPDADFETIRQLCIKNEVSFANTVSWSRDYEPFARQRDGRIQKLIEGFGCETLVERDHLIIEPMELLKDDGTPYQVFTPFAKKWYQLLATKNIQQRIVDQRKGLSFLSEDLSKVVGTIFSLKWQDILGKFTLADSFQSMNQANQKKVSVPIPPAGSRRAFLKASSWSEDIHSYGNLRDIPSKDGTSKFSIYFKNGSLTTSQVVAFFDLESPVFAAENGGNKFLKELVWREFYYHLLWHYPRVETEAFQLRYKDLHWDNDEIFFEAWKHGLTGFPIVDAGMRQLLTTGWMHNRVRMIVASFLTKDLLIDWRWGEKWFMQKLLDGDLAPNNGGWQWAASTGCDAQPYFRIFNPESQSLRFDPEGKYIREFVPELSSLSNKEIHNPSAEVRKRLKYPAPIVDHAKQRIRAMMLFKR